MEPKEDTTLAPVAESVNATFSFEAAKENMAGKTFREVIGRRKTAIARVRVTLDKKLAVTVNGKPSDEYFHADLYRTACLAPITLLGVKEGLSFSVVVNGGGISAQADAIRHGLARALVFLDPAMRSALKKSGHLKRDPRKKERKKPGLKKARKSAQWSKR